MYIVLFVALLVNKWMLSLKDKFDNIKYILLTEISFLSEGVSELAVMLILSVSYKLKFV